MMTLAEIEINIATVRDDPDSVDQPAEHLLNLGEQILENWLIAHEQQPTDGKREGFRLLALHRQSAKGNPSFNACRESCRELVYRINLYQTNTSQQQVTLSAMVAMHLLLFIRGKMETAELGEFCCSSKTLRTRQSDS